MRICFGLDGAAWDEEKVLERYELLYEAGLVEEAGATDASAARDWSGAAAPRRPMRFDHRRILATAIGRVRAKIKYRPVIFELMPDDFTLFELQRTVEAILGPHLHKQNFRRLVEGAGLVETDGRSEDAHRRPSGEALSLPSRGAARASGTRRTREAGQGLTRCQQLSHRMLREQRPIRHAGPHTIPGHWKPDEVILPSPLECSNRA